MNKKYKVIHIYEGDYGCEELAPDAEPMVDVILMSDDGIQKVIHEKDSLLYKLDINEGDEVYIKENGIEKAE